MDEQNIPQEETQQTPSRPLWQRIAALIGVLVLLIGFLLYCRHIAGGGI